MGGGRGQLPGSQASQGQAWDSSLGPPAAHPHPWSQDGATPGPVATAQGDDKHAHFTRDSKSETQK